MPVKVHLRWILAAILCACTLVALWVTAARVKGQKMAARYGERIEAEPAMGPESLVLRRGDRRQVAHFTLQHGGDALAVLDANGRPLVEFAGMKRGEIRRWQELQLTVLEAAPDALTLQTDFRPGSPCFGAGTYRSLKAGLRIEMGGGRTITVTSWDPSRPEITVRFEGPAGAVQNTFGAEGKGEVFRIRYALRRDASLILETLDGG